jgi:hypothetical protein
VYRPGSGLSGPTIFDTWAGVMGQLATLRAGNNGGGCYTIMVDDSIVSPAIIPPGAYDLTDVTLSGRVSEPTAVRVVEGVSFAKLRNVTGQLNLEFVGATAPVSDFSASGETFRLQQGSSVVANGSGPVFRISNSTTIEVSDHSSVLTGNTEPVAIVVIDITLIVIAIVASVIQAIVVSDPGPGSTTRFVWDTSSAVLSENQPGITGSLEVVNPTVERRFPTVVISSNVALDPNVVARVDVTGGPVTVTLPSAFDNRGVSVVVKHIAGDATINNVTVAAQVGDTIDGIATFVIKANNISAVFTSDGNTNWMITSTYVPGTIP